MPKIAISNWLLFNFLVAFSFYWAANLLLWFPWSINAILGMTLMLTVGPFLWAWGVYMCLVRFPGSKVIEAVAINALILLIVAAGFDLVFYGFIRNAMEDLYHPTTFYAYAFLVFLPAAEGFIFRKKLKHERKPVRMHDMLYISLMGLVSLALLIIIIKFNITI